MQNAQPVKVDRPRSVPWSIRTTPEVKANVRRLAAVISSEMGMRVTMTQAIEAAVYEALVRRGEMDER